MPELMYLAVLVVPLGFGVILFFTRNRAAAGVVQRFASVAVLAVVGFAAYELMVNKGSSLGELPEWVDWGMIAFELGLLLYAAYRSIVYRKWGTLALLAVQAALTTYFELVLRPTTRAPVPLRADELSVVMLGIIALTGGVICFFAVSYMKDYHHHHPEVKDRRPFFSFLLFTFLAAMSGLVVANDLSYLNFFWEITTICSFFLIGYARNEESVKSAFRALFLNLLGGIALTFGIIYCAWNGIAGLDGMLGFAKAGGAAGLLVASAFIIAGLVKSAQLPFSPWLLGAMVAPTPVSALLHSSTMVKAGVFMVLRVAPFVVGTVVAGATALIGGLTFLVASCMAIATSNAKRILALSTIANLGLIVACAGIGTSATIAAAVLLVIFHAAAKSLLFLSVGSTEHVLGSRDVESMDFLISRVPSVAPVMTIGIVGMFLPPLGMLISKYVVLGAFIDAHSIMSPFLILMLAFGSAFNLFFWTKWLGKIITPMPSLQAVGKPPRSERASLWVLAAGVIAACFSYPWIISLFVEPLVGDAGLAAKISSNFLTLAVMLLMLFAVPAALLLVKRRRAGIKPYLAGRNVGEGGLNFTDTFGVPAEPKLRNYYFPSFIQEGTLLRAGGAAAVALIAAMLIGSYV